MLAPQHNPKKKEASGEGCVVEAVGGVGGVGAVGAVDSATLVPAPPGIFVRMSRQEGLAGPAD